MARPNHNERRALLAELFRRHPHYAREGVDPKGVLSSDLVGDLSEILEDRHTVRAMQAALPRPGLEPVMLGLSVLVPPLGYADASIIAPVSLLFERLVVARESALDACTMHEDCQQFWEIGVACLASRLPPGVSVLPGFDVHSIRAGLTEFVIGEPLHASALLGAQPAQRGVVVGPGVPLRVYVYNRDVRERTFKAHFAGVAVPQTMVTASELEAALAALYRPVEIPDVTTRPRPTDEASSETPPRSRGRGR